MCDRDIDFPGSSQSIEVQLSQVFFALASCTVFAANKQSKLAKRGSVRRCSRAIALPFSSKPPRSDSIFGILLSSHRNSVAVGKYRVLRGQSRKKEVEGSTYHWVNVTTCAHANLETVSPNTGIFTWLRLSVAMQETRHSTIWQRALWLFGGTAK
jgi:hypothetical protein